MHQAQQKRGQFDFEMLGNEYDPRDLVAWEFGEDELGFGDPEADEKSGGAGDSEDSDTDDARIVHCPKCNHDFSILTEKKKKK